MHRVRVRGEGDVTTEAETGMIHLKMEEEATTQEHRHAREAENSKEMGSLLRTSRKIQPCRHLDFGPVRLISDF